MHFAAGRKHGSLGTQILQFNRKITKLTKTVQKLSENSQSDNGAVIASSPLVYQYHNHTSLTAAFKLSNTQLELVNE